MDTTASRQPDQFKFRAHVRRHNAAAAGKAIAYGFGGAIVWLATWWAAWLAMYVTLTGWRLIEELPHVSREAIPHWAFWFAWLIVGALALQLRPGRTSDGDWVTGYLGRGLTGTPEEMRGRWLLGRKILDPLAAGLLVVEIIATAPRWTLASLAHWRSRVVETDEALAQAASLFQQLLRRGGWVPVVELEQPGRSLALLERAGLLWVRAAGEMVTVRIPPGVTVQAGGNGGEPIS